MNEPVLLFETDPQLGIPRLQSLHGAASTWGFKDLGPLEELLRPRYEEIVRQGQGVVEYRGKHLQVKRKDGDVSRQPTLELRLEEPRTARPVRMAELLKPAPARPAWALGFLEEVDRLFASPAFEKLLAVEKAMLNLVREELRQLVEDGQSTPLAQLMLVSLLMTAEHLSRTQRPTEPQPYAIALGALERLLNQDSAPARTPWGTLPAETNSKPPPFWLNRWWQRVCGHR
jgi:hypothetical protein